MVLLSILLDAVAAGLYYLQLSHGNTPIYALGIVIQAALTIALIVFMFTYKGQRRSRIFNFESWTRNITIRYAVIMFSAILNALVLFLYVLNITGANNLIFSN